MVLWFWFFSNTRNHWLLKMKLAPNTGPEWTSTHQCTNVDGWYTDRILFSIHVPSQVDFFGLSFLSPDQPWSQFFFATLFSPQPPPGFFFCFWNFSHPPNYYPHYPPPTYSPIYLIKSRLFPIYLLTYKFKMCYSHPHPPTHPITDLPTNTLSMYLSNPAYMVIPTYMVAIAIDPNNWQQWGKNKLKVLHGACSCSFKQINKRTIKIFNISSIKVLQTKWIIKVIWNSSSI